LIVENEVYLIQFGLADLVYRSTQLRHLEEDEGVGGGTVLDTEVALVGRKAERVR